MAASTLTESIGPSNKPSTPSFIGGVYLPELSTDAVTSLKHSMHDGFDYVVTDLPVLNNNNTAAIIGAARSDVTRLGSKWWSTSVVGLIRDPPNWNHNDNTTSTTSSTSSSRVSCYPGTNLMKALTSIDNSSSTSHKRNEANAVLTGMLEWACHMNIPAVILPPVPLVEYGAENDVDVNMMDDNNSNYNNIGRISNNNKSAKEYARLLSTIATSAICTTSHVQLWIRVPLSLPGLRSFQHLMARCDHNPSIGAMLYVDSSLDAKSVPEMINELHLFIGYGNVKAVSWDVSIFLKNKKGYPAFSKSHQYVFQLLFGRLGRTLRLLVEGMVGPMGVEVDVKEPTNIGQYGGGSTGRLQHLQYLRHLRSRPQVSELLDSDEAVIETSYLDHLQSPLQPLGDHLEYQTYETFEKDPVKYKNYGDAIVYALEDGIDCEHYKCVRNVQTTNGELKKMIRQAQSNSSSEEDLFEDVQVVVGIDGETVRVDMHKVTILVVGAGRGPLVREAIKAVSRVSASWINKTSSGNQVRKSLYAKIIAVEKNPSAILYLESLKACEATWNGGHLNNVDNDDMEIIPGSSMVEVVGCDMRQAADSVLKFMVDDPDLRGDIMVSELLGSFGDNELSPECLDGVQACGILKDTCVSIPQSYTAYIAPISSTRLYNEAKNQSCHPLNSNQGPSGPSIGLQRAMETPYVVRSHAASQTHSEQECWTYAHPHSTSINEINDTDSSRNLSANVAKNVINDRHAHLSFHHDTSHGVAMGCGYGASNPEILSTVTATTDESSSKSPGDDIYLMIHGMLGTFHSVLYQSKDKTKISTISIAPHSFSVGMFSWFPLYFPLREPLRVPPKACLNCSIWRRSDKERVWYEWCAEVVSIVGDGEVVLNTGYVHNPGGRSYHVRL